MPIYEYKCNKCGVFEAMQGIKESPLRKCPTCKGKVERQMSSGSFILKGSGWYATDYAKKSPSKDTEASESPKTNGDSSAASNGSASNGSKSSSESSKSGDSSKATDSTKSSSESSAKSSKESKPASESKSSSEKSAPAKAAD